MGNGKSASGGRFLAYEEQQDFSDALRVSFAKTLRPGKL